jgi:hypothetical protein
MSKLKYNLNSMCQGPIHGGCVCCCIISKPNGGQCACASTSYVVPRVKAMCEFIICPKFDNEKFHKLECIKRECNMCGISKLQFYLILEVDPNNKMLIFWKRFENVYIGQYDDH